MTAKISIKGWDRIFEKSELSTINIDDLKKNIISPGYVFHFSRTGKSFNLLKAGDFLDNYFFDKFISEGFKSFYILPIVNNTNVEFLTKNLKALGEDADELHKINCRNQIVQYFSNYFWSDKTGANKLDFVMACLEVFYKVPNDVLLELKNNNLEILDRSLLQGSLAVYVSIIVGYFDFKILSDIFHTGFFLPYGLMDENFNFTVSNAYNAEIDKPGIGLKTISQSPKDLSYLMNHPKRGLGKLEKIASKIYYNPEVAKIILRQHELRDGQGFPNGIPQSALFELETVFILLNYLLPRTHNVYQLDDIKGSLKKWLQLIEESKIADSLPCSRIIKRLKNELTNIKIVQNVDEPKVGEL